MDKRRWALILDLEHLKDLASIESIGRGRLIDAQAVARRGDDFELQDAIRNQIAEIDARVAAIIDRSLPLVSEMREILTKLEAAS